MHHFFKESVIHMKPEIARSLAIRMSQIMERYNQYAYADMLMEYDDNEELMLEDLVNHIETRPDIVFDDMIRTMELMLVELKR